MKPSSPPASARPSRRRFDTAQALDTAVELFWRHGYEGTSMAMLLQAMGLTAPSLYAAFGSKEQLFQLAVKRYLETVGARLMEPLAGPGPAREAIERMLLNSAATATSTQNPHGCLASFGALNHADPTAKPVTLLQGVRAAIAQRIRHRIERAVAEGELPAATDPARLARFYHAVLGGLQLRSLDGASRAELETIARDAMLAWPSPAAR